MWTLRIKYILLGAIFGVVMSGGIASFAGYDLSEQGDAIFAAIGGLGGLFATKFFALT